MKHPRITLAAGVLLAGLAVMQAAAPPRTNPPVDPALRLEAHAEVPAPIAATLRRACFDCHSDETRWPWYARVPPASLLVGRDVVAGRGQVNFSRWGDYNPYDRADLLDKACELVKKGEMPLPPYLALHAEARLAPPDVEALCAWTQREAARLTGEAPPE
jgi:hypothetical protein